MAHIADPAMLAPSSTSEACLRIEQAMKGAKANGKLVQHRFPHNITNILFDAGRGPALMSYEFDSVDVNAFYEAVQHDREGRLKTVGAAWGGEHSHADPMVYDTYTHEDEPGDEVVFVVPDSGNPHFGRTKKRVRIDLQPPLDSAVMETREPHHGDKIDKLSRAIETLVELLQKK